MAMMNIDFSSVPSREPLPEGVYELRIAKVEERKAKSTGDPMLNIEFDVLSEGYTNRKLWANYMLTENCYWKLKELFESLGLDTSAAVSMDTSELVGLQCSAKVAQREYNGEIQNEIKKTM